MSPTKIADLFVDLKLDSTSFTRDLGTTLRRASAQSVTVAVDLDTTKASASLAKFARSQSMSINVDADTRAASTQIDRAARNREAKVKVDVQGQKGINFAFKGVSNLTTAIAALGPASIPVLGAVTAGAGAMGSALLSAGAAGGVFAAAVQGQIAAMKEAQKNLKVQRDGLAKLAPGTKEYADKLKQVNSLQREFNQNFGPAAKGFNNLKTAWSGFLDATSKTTLPVIGKGLNLVSDLLPRLVPLANAAGRAVGGLLDDLTKWSKGAQFAGLLKMFRRDGPAAITAFGHAAGNVISGVLSLFQGFEPASKGVLNGFVRLTAAFRNWAQSFGKSDALKGFIDSAKQNLPAIEQLFANLFQIIGKVVVALGPLAGLQFKALLIFTNLLNNLPVSVLTELSQAIVGTILALKAWEVASKAVTIAQKAWDAIMVVSTGIQKAFNLAMKANTIGIIIAALVGLIAILVEVYRHNKTFHDAVVATWAAIKTAIGAAWNFIKPILGAIGQYIVKNVIPAFQRLWHNVVVPAMKAIGAIIKWAWDNVVKPVFAAYKFYIMNIVIPAIKFLWHNVVVPAFKAIGAVIRFAWNNVIKPAWSALHAYLTNVLFPVIRFLYNNVVKPVFTALGNIIKGVWNGVIKPVFSALKTGVNDVKDVFDRVVRAIGKIWDTLKSKFKEPIKVAFDFVNSKVVGPINSVLGKLPGGLKIPSLPKLARGGPVWGAGTETSDSIPAMLSNGEYVIRAKQAKKHKSLLDRINTEGLPGFAGGGIIGDIGHGISNAAGAVKSGVSSAANFTKNLATMGARKAAELILKPLQNGLNNLIGKPTNLAKAMMRSTSDKLFQGVFGQADKVKKTAGGSASGKLGAAAPGKGLIAGGYTITSYPGANHVGYDLAVPIGTPIYAPWAGRITRSYDIPGYEPRQPDGGNGYRSYGRVVQAAFNNGVRGLFAHLSARRGVGPVSAGTMMGRTGDTGNSSGPHLHVEGLGPSAFKRGGMIPAFANGGIVTRPTLALIGERGPEAVLPFAKGGQVSATTAKRRAALRAQLVSIGNDVKNGFDNSTVGKTLRTLITKNLSGKTEKLMLARLNTLVARNKQLASINKQQGIISSNTAARQEFVGSLHDTIAPNIGDYAQSPGGILGGLRAQLASVTTFTARMKALKTAGYPNGLIMQVAGLGLTNGIAAADQLLKASPTDKSSIINTFGQLNTAATTGMAQQIGNALFNPAIDAAKKALAKLPKEPDVIKAMGSLGKAIIDGMIKTLHLNPPKPKGGGGGHTTGGGGGHTTGGGGGNPGGGGGHTTGGGGGGGNSPKDIVRRAMNARGWGNQWSAINQLIQHESSWNPRAENPTTSASGLFQFVDGTARAYGLPGHASRFSVAAQTTAGMKYIKARYGNPNGAWSFWQKHHWYDSGGWLQQGRTMAINGTGKPEAVLTSQQWTQMERLISAVEAGRGGSAAPLIGHAVIRENVDLDRYERQRAFRDRMTRV